MNKLFVWEEFACDYSCGLAFAVAETREEAIRIITEKDGGKNDYMLGKLEEQNPEVYELSEKNGFAVYGGQ